ncbi:siphovirus Gp157 family protein [Ignavigranum ruoffiae]|uniref:siphovirus Gp157 family protein n=1 Tax=Ignavigranum ruoffiae TaxID=89093 RepID=UPI002352DB46|nr:siphovirus Gp157 family protein [Ignavigranum ruoffiae]
MNLYELSHRFAFLQRQYEHLESDDDLSQLESELTDTEVPLADKVENIAKFIRNLESEEKAYKSESDYFKKKSTKAKRTKERLKDYLLTCLTLADVQEVPGDLFTVSVRNNAPKLNILTNEHIPEEYFEPQPSRLKLAELKKDVIKNGLYVEGVEIIDNPSIQIK